MQRSFVQSLAAATIAAVALFGQKAVAAPTIDPFLVESVSFGPNTLLGPPRFLFEATGSTTFININEIDGSANTFTLGEFSLLVDLQQVGSGLTLIGGTVALRGEETTTGNMADIFRSTSLQSFDLNTSGGVAQFEFTFLQDSTTSFDSDPAFAVPANTVIGGFLKYEGLNVNDIPPLTPAGLFSFTNSIFKGSMTVVPEPVSAGMMLLAGCAMVRRRSIGVARSCR